MDIRSRDQELNELVLEGKALEAFEKFYAEDVVMQDPGAGPWEGKDTNRKREEDFFGSVTELRTMELHDVAYGDGVTMSTWTFDYTHEEWGEVAYTQVAVRHWNDQGLIQKERFFKG